MQNLDSKTPRLDYLLKRVPGDKERFMRTALRDGPQDSFVPKPVRLHLINRQFKPLVSITYSHFSRILLPKKHSNVSADEQVPEKMQASEKRSNQDALSLALFRVELAETLKHSKDIFQSKIRILRRGKDWVAQCFAVGERVVNADRFWWIHVTLLYPNIYSAPIFLDLFIAI